MSSRTFQASKAVALGWYREQELVKEGKGTRDWTPEQQQDIIDRGKAYDEDGKAFQGHHMKSVELFPEFQGDPQNIQFLSVAEHKAAHGGSYRNLTNGYYDPVAGLTKEFAVDVIEPCRIIELSTPIIQTLRTDEDVSQDSQKQEFNQQKESGCKEENNTKNNTEPTLEERWETYMAEDRKKEEEKRKRRASKPLLRFLDNNVKPFLAKLGVRTAEQICDPDSTLNTIINTGLDIYEAFSEAREESMTNEYSSKEASSPEGNSTAADTPEASSDKPDSSLEHNYPSERISPIEHMVNPQKPRRYGSTYKVQSPYKRGGKKRVDVDEDNDDCDD